MLFHDCTQYAHISLCVDKSKLQNLQVKAEVCKNSSAQILKVPQCSLSVLKRLKCFRVADIEATNQHQFISAGATPRTLILWNTAGPSEYPVLSCLAQFASKHPGAKGDANSLYDTPLDLSWIQFPSEWRQWWALSKAGIPCDLLVAAHGNFDAAHVVDDNVGLASSYDVDIAVPRCRASWESRKFRSLVNAFVAMNKSWWMWIFIAFPKLLNPKDCREQRAHEGTSCAYLRSCKMPYTIPAMRDGRSEPFSECWCGHVWGIQMFVLLRSRWGRMREDCCSLLIWGVINGQWDREAQWFIWYLPCGIIFFSTFAYWNIPSIYAP